MTNTLEQRLITLQKTLQLVRDGGNKLTICQDLFTEALSIIEILQKELNIWASKADELQQENTQLAASKRALTYENGEYIKALQYINASDEEGQIKTNLAHKTLKKFGKL